MTSLRWLSLCSFVFTVAACSGGGGASGGGGPVNPPSKVQSEPSPICASPLNLPLKFGTDCSAGSNLSLCLMSGDDQCGDRSACLFDNRATGMATYCTIACDPSAAKACPSGYSCLRESCDNKTVCVRDGNQPTDPNAGFFIQEEDLPGDPTNYAMVVKAANPAGDNLIVDSGSGVFLRQANGTWRNLSLNSDIGQAYPKKISVIGNAFYLYYVMGWDSGFRDQRRVYKVEGDVVSLVPMPSDQTGAFCEGVSRPGCYGEVGQLWQDKSGALNIIVSGSGDARHFKSSGSGWTRLQTPKETLLFAVNKAQRMADGSYMTYEAPFKISDDLVSWTEIPMPPGLTESRYIMVRGFAKNDIWLGVNNEGYLAHWNGSKWIVETAFKGHYLDYLVKLGPNQYVVGDLNNAHIYQTDCWRKVSPLNETAIITGPGRGSIITEGRVKTFNLGFVPQF